MLEDHTKLKTLDKYVFYFILAQVNQAQSFETSLCRSQLIFVAFNNLHRPMGESQKQTQQTDNESTMFPFPAKDLFNFLFP